LHNDFLPKMSRSWDIVHRGHMYMWVVTTYYKSMLRLVYTCDFCCGFQMWFSSPDVCERIDELGWGTMRDDDV
jgi:hypothetical protein